MPRLTWLGVWAALIAADAATTLYGLGTGIAEEANPAAAAILHATNPAVMVAVGVAACAVLAASPLLPWPRPLYRRTVWATCGVALAGKAAVVASNLVVLANA